MNNMSDERLHFMKRTAVGAGQIIMKYWDTGVRSRYKDDKSVVTEADLRSNEFITTELAREYSDYGMLSEESGDDLSRLSKPRVFVVDPLDGSGDFKRKEDDFCVLLAAVENGVPTLGVVYEPKKQRLFSAERGGQACVAHGVKLTNNGLWVDDEGVLGHLKPVLWDDVIVGHPKNYEGDKYTKLYELMGIPEGRLKFSGSMGTRMMQAALQETHAILGYTRSLKEWDAAAGHAILDAGGMSVTDIHGNPLKYNQEAPKTHNGILVVHPDAKDAALAHLKRCLKVLPM